MSTVVITSLCGIYRMSFSEHSIVDSIIGITIIGAREGPGVVWDAVGFGYEATFVVSPWMLVNRRVLFAMSEVSSLGLFYLGFMAGSPCDASVPIEIIFGFFARAFGVGVGNADISSVFVTPSAIWRLLSYRCLVQ